MFSSLAPAFPLQFPSCVMFTSSPGLRDLHILPSQQHSTQARRVASTAQTTMVRFSEGTFSNGRSQHLHTTEYFPDQLPMPRAVVFWHHGYGEHSGRYAAVHRQLAEAGFAVHSYDHHGHGRSEPKERGERALIHSFDHLVDDSEAYARSTRARYDPGLPCFSAGQSMGGLIAAHLVLRDQAAWAGLILCSAAIDVEWNLTMRLQAPLGGLLAALLPRAQIVPAVPLDQLSNDPIVVNRFADDPLNFVGNVRAMTANEIMRGFRDIQRKEAQLTVPILAMHGTADKITSYTAVKRLLESARSQDKELKEFPGGYHELLMGPEKAEAAQMLIDWLGRHSPDPPAKL